MHHGLTIPDHTVRVIAQDEVEHLLSHATPRQREVIRLVLGGYTHPEIAAELNIHLGTVQQRITRGLQQIRSGGPKRRTIKPKSTPTRKRKRRGSKTMTPRKLEVLAAYKSGAGYPDMARQLGMAENTVRNVIQKIRRIEREAGRILPFRPAGRKPKRDTIEK